MKPLSSNPISAGSPATITAWLPFLNHSIGIYSRSECVQTLWQECIATETGKHYELGSVWLSVWMQPGERGWGRREDIRHPWNLHPDIPVWCLWATGELHGENGRVSNTNWQTHLSGMAPRFWSLSSPLLGAGGGILSHHLPLKELYLEIVWEAITL